MRPPRRILPVLTAAISIAALLSLAPAGPAAAAVSVHAGPATIASGIQWTRYNDVLGDGKSRKINVLQITPSTTATIDVVMPFSSLPGSKLLSAMVPSGNGAAGINGDFGFSRPEHALLVDGALWQSGMRTNQNFAIQQSEARAFIDRPTTKVAVLNKAGGRLFGVDRWNAGKPGAGEVAGFSPQGGSIENPGGGCSARLASPGPLTWAPLKEGLRRSYTVEARQCASGAMAENGKIVLNADSSGAGANEIKALSVGQKVSVEWSLGFAGVVDSIGGDPQILNNGAVTQDATGARCVPNQHITLGCSNPRTAIGINQACVTGGSGCRVFFVVVDGRQGTWSAGYTLPQLATFMKNQLGAYDVLNLDGGGSAGMWVKKANLPSGACQSVGGDVNTNVGCFVNRPSTNGTDIVERKIESAVLVRSGSDSGEPTPAGG